MSTDRSSLIYSFARFFGLRGRELGLPKLVHDGLVDVAEDKVEDFGVPADSVALDAGFDVLFIQLAHCVVFWKSRWD